MCEGERRGKKEKRCVKEKGGGRRKKVCEGERRGKKEKRCVKEKRREERERKHIETY